MYTLQSAASMLDVSLLTLRNWIAEDKIETEISITDRKRKYLTYDSIVALANKHRPLTVIGTDVQTNYPDLTGLYSTADAARLMGVKESTVKKWIANSKVEKQIVITDRKRIYIPYSSLITLANMHNVTISYDQTNSEKESNTPENVLPQEDRLYSVAEAAIFLGVTEHTVRNWLGRYNIERQNAGSDERRIYIAYSDLLKLQNKRKRSSVRSANLTTSIMEIKDKLENLEAGMLRLEKYIKRSIYLGN